MNAARWGKRVTSIIGLIVAWFVVATVGPELLPGPLAVASAFADRLGEGAYWGAVVSSTARVWGAFVLAAVIAVPLSLLIGWNDVFGDFTFPALEILRPIPPIAWLAFSILVIPAVTISIPGLGGVGVDTSVVFIAFLGAFFPILLNTIDGVRSIDEEFPRAASSLGAAKFQTFRHVIYPGALPSIQTGMVVGIGLAWVNLVAAEMVGTGGLGFLTWSAYTSGSYPVIIVGMASIGVMGYLSSSVIRWIGAWQLSWVDTTA